MGVKRPAGAGPARWEPSVAEAPHLVAVPAVVADHLRAFVRDMLRDGGQEVGGGEDLEVAVDLGVEPRAVDHHVRGPLQGHLLNGEGIAQDVLGQILQVRLGLGRHRLAGVDVEAAVSPGVEDLDAFPGRSFCSTKRLMTLARKSSSRGLSGESGRGWKLRVEG